METLRRVESTVPLATSKLIVAFMKELLQYQMWATKTNVDMGFPPIKKVGSMLLHKPYVDTSIPYNEIKEFAWVLGLDNRRNAVFIDLLSVGDVARASVPLSAPFRGTAIFEANCLVLLHNHPSGDLEPSENDLNFTKDILLIGSKLERPLIDHIILGKEDDYFSFEDEGELTRLTQLLKDEQLAPHLLKQIQKQLEQEKKLSSQLLDEVDLRDQVILKKDKSHKQDQKIIEDLKKEIEKLKKAHL